MNVEDFKSSAYMQGRSDCEASRALGHPDTTTTFPNPYDYGTNEWQLWNLGWNHELQQNG